NSKTPFSNEVLKWTVPDIQKRQRFNQNMVVEWMDKSSSFLSWLELEGRTNSDDSVKYVSSSD
ncbi:hypothetical protein HNY73_007824, partial [Argiope bruennichi]